MALNWTMVTEDGAAPVPLPGEKVFFSAPGCELTLTVDDANLGPARAQGQAPGKAFTQRRRWSARGTSFVTNQRVVFLRQPQLQLPPSSSFSTSSHGKEAEQPPLNSLSVPLAHFLDTRYLIPVFGAPYYEATVVPVPGGGLPELALADGVGSGGGSGSKSGGTGGGVGGAVGFLSSLFGSSSASSSAAPSTSSTAGPSDTPPAPSSSSAPAPAPRTIPSRGTCLLYFHQGRGLDFRAAVEEVKARAEEQRGHYGAGGAGGAGAGAEHMEPLPVYDEHAHANAAAGSSSGGGSGSGSGNGSAAAAASAEAASSVRARAPAEAGAAGASASTSTSTSTSTRSLGGGTSRPEPDRGMLEAASVARECEEREREAQQRGAIVAGQHQLHQQQQQYQLQEQGVRGDRGAGEEGGEGGAAAQDDRQPRRRASMLHPSDAEAPPAYEDL